MLVSISLSASTLSRSALGILAKASLVGANTVMFWALLRVSTRPAFFTAVTRVDRAGLLEAAVATGSWAMPSKEPAPSLGTVAQAGPNGPSAGVPSAGALDFSSAGAELEDLSAAASEELSSPPQAVSVRGGQRRR